MGTPPPPPPHQGHPPLPPIKKEKKTRKVKGPDRPVNTLEDRITVLAGLQSVDYIVSFEEESPVQLIKSVRPDVFVKGADYTEKSIPELPLLKRLSCEVKIIPNVHDISTTDIIHRINEIVEDAEQKNEIKNLQKLMEEKSML